MTKEGRHSLPAQFDRPWDSPYRLEGDQTSLREARENFVARSIEAGAMQGEEAVHFRDRIEDLSPEELEDFLKEANEGGVDG